MHSAAHTAAAAASSNSTGSSAAGRPIDTTRNPRRGQLVDDAGGRDVDDLVALIDPGRREIGAEPGLALAADRRERDEHRATGGDHERGHAVVRDAAVPFPWIRERRAQARDRGAVQSGRRVEHRPDLDAGEAEAGRGTDDPGPHHDHDGVRVRDLVRDRERAVHRHGLVVAPERVTAGDRRVDQLLVAQLRHEIRQCERQRGTVGHHVREARVGPALLERDRDRRQLAVQRGGDDGHALDRDDVGELGPVLLGAADVGLEAGVARLDDVPRAGLGPLGSGEVPVHDVPATGAEPELDRGRVHDDVVAEVDPSGELCEHVRALATVAEVDLDPLQARRALRGR